MRRSGVRIPSAPPTETPPDLHTRRATGGVSSFPSTSVPGPAHRSRAPPRRAVGFKRDPADGQDGSPLGKPQPDPLLSRRHPGPHFLGQVPTTTSQHLGPAGQAETFPHLKRRDLVPDLEFIDARGSDAFGVRDERRLPLLTAPTSEPIRGHPAHDRTGPNENTPAMLRQPTSGPPTRRSSIRPTPDRIKGADASLRDDLRPPLTRPLRQALVLRYGFGGSPWSHVPKRRV